MTSKCQIVVVDRLFHQAYVGFRRFCVESENLPVDLHIVLSDILQEAGLYMQTNVTANVPHNYYHTFLLHCYVTC